jgi:hypothetical protein
MTRARVVGLGFATLLAGSAWVHASAQSGQPAAAPGVIAGRVIDAVTGEPIAGARVVVNWVNPSPALRAATRDPRVASPGLRTTDEAGRFEYTGVEPGLFRLGVSALGYLRSSLGAQAAWEGFASSVEHELTPGERLTDLVIRMWPGGSISGVVRDEQGEPVVKAAVELFRRAVVYGQAGWQRLPGRAETDDRGMYRLGSRSIDNMAGAPTLQGPGAGEYLIVVRPGRPGLGVSIFDGPVFAPGVRLASAAQVIALGDAEHRAGVDVVVRTGSARGGFPVNGRLTGALRLRAPLRVHLVPSGSVGELATLESYIAQADTTGRFTFSDIPAGDYRLQAWQFPELAAQAVEVLTPGGGLRIPDRTLGGNRRPLAPLPVEPTWVADLPLTVERAIDDVSVPMRPGARITGRIHFDGDGRPPAGEELLAVPVVVYTLERDLGLVPVARVEADGSFVSVGLPPERYRLDVRFREFDGRAASTWWPSSRTIDGRPVLPGGLIDVGASDLEVAITYTDRRAELTGTLRDRTGRLRPAARVILFSRDSAAATACLRILAPDREAVFRTTTWPAAECLAAAVLNPPEGWRDPKYLESLAPFAVPFRVERGQTRTLNLIVGP